MFTSSVQATSSKHALNPHLAFPEGRSDASLWDKHFFWNQNVFGIILQFAKQFPKQVAKQFLKQVAKQFAIFDLERIALLKCIRTTRFKGLLVHRSSDGTL